MTTIDAQRFFDARRERVGRMGQKQVDGYNAIFKACSLSQELNDRKIAYILATAHHETGGRLEPVRETFAISDEQARARLHKARYAKTEDNGYSYYGRGFVQLTWRANYVKMGARLGIDLEDDPDLAMVPSIAADILVIGMVEGLFTGRRLGEFFTMDKSDAVQARRIVNGLDCAEKIARLSKVYLECLRPPPMNTVLVL